MNFLDLKRTSRGLGRGNLILLRVQGSMRSGDLELALSLLKDAASNSLSLSSLEMPSLPSSLEASQTVTLESFLHELNSGQRSSSTERLHKLLSMEHLQARHLPVELAGVPSL